MTREIQVGDLVVVTKKVDIDWVEEMDQYINNGNTYKVTDVMIDSHDQVFIDLQDQHFTFPLASVELIDSHPIDKSNILTPASTNIQGCTFYGVHWEEKALATVQTVADALLMNAMALNSLSDLFKSQNIQIDSLLTVGGSK